MLNVKEQTLIFSSGRRISIQRGVVGISPLLEVFHGYDGILLPSEPFLDDDDALTDLERIELADYMIALWQLFKTQALKPRYPLKESNYSDNKDDF